MYDDARRMLELLVRVLVALAVLRCLERHTADVPRVVVSDELPLRQRGRALQDAQVIEKELSVEVVDLVLETATEEIAGLALECRALAIEGPNRHDFRSFHVRIDVGNGKTSFFALRLSRRR